LGDDFTISSKCDEDYNCVAWGFNNSHQYWWPGPKGSGCYWPPGIPPNEKLETFILLFEDQFVERSASREREEGFDKVAIYAANGKSKHVARLWLEDPTWMSKLGPKQDIHHHSLEALEGRYYGSVAQIMKRKRRTRGGPAFTFSS